MLNKISKRHNTDKGNGHNYIPHYQSHFAKFQNEKIKLLEIGIGGDDNQKAGGDSLRMWKEYFKNGLIFGLDLYDKSKHSEDRITIYKGSQDDFHVLDKVCEGNEFDIIIDDGSHVQEHIITTFQYLFSKLKSGGIYVIEDIQTSYWGSKWSTSGANAMEVIKSLCDGLNHSERVGIEPNYFDKNITSIHFYHNLIFIYKGENTEPSNIVFGNKRNSITG